MHVIFGLSTMPANGLRTPSTVRAVPLPGVPAYFSRCHK